MIKNILFMILIFPLLNSCCNNENVINRIHSIPTKTDTVYVLFEDGIGKMNKYRSFQYKNHDPKYYYIRYNFPTYWKQPGDPEESFIFEGDYNHSFWFGTYIDVKTMNISEIYGNSTVLKKHKSFFLNHEIIDYEWFKLRDPNEVTKALNLKKTYREKPIFFIIDINEFEKDSIILRNVIYHKEIIE